MFYKLSCGCIALITDQVHDDQGVLQQVTARTVEYCGMDPYTDIPYTFRNPVVYQRDDKGSGPNKDSWDKIQEGVRLTEAEEAALYENLNAYLTNGWKYGQIKLLLA